jgi:hypothetical protein
MRGQHDHERITGRRQLRVAEETPVLRPHPERLEVVADDRHTIQRDRLAGRRRHLQLDRLVSRKV